MISSAVENKGCVRACICKPRSTAPGEPGSYFRQSSSTSISTKHLRVKVGSRQATGVGLLPVAIIVCPSFFDVRDPSEFAAAPCDTPRSLS
jgi:hypothetical protein